MNSGGQWPFPGASRPVREGAYDPSTGQATDTVVSAAAEALDTDPAALPTLNDRVDPDCVDSLVAERAPETPSGVRVAVELSFGEVSVLLDDEGRIELYLAGREPNELEAAATHTHDWSSDEPLLWSVGRAVAEASDEQSSAVAGGLAERVDADAVNRLLRPRADGADRKDSRLLLSVDGHEIAVEPGGSIAVEPSLAVLERSGAAVLLVGSVPERGFDRASAALLGDAAGSAVFALHGRDPETARRRLSIAGTSPAAGTVLDCHATARAASAASHDDDPADEQPTVVPVPDGVRGLPGAVREVVGDPETTTSGELRVCVDSLSSMLDANDVESTREDIEALCRIVRHRRGIGTFVLPVAADHGTVETLAPSFDAVVELRTGDVGVEQRWRLTGTGHETPWFPVG